MKSRALLNIGVAALTLAACAAHSGETKKTLRIQIPKSLANHKVLVTTGECGLFGGVFGPITSRPGMWEFSMNVRTDAAEVKVLACIPGYTIATLTMKPEDIPDAPIALNFRKLPTVPVTVKLTTYDGAPIPGKKVVLRQSIPEQEFLGYCDGAVFAPQAEPVATGVTNSRGMLSVRVPQILDDPIAGILQRPMSYKPYFWASVEPSEDGTHVEPLMFYAQKEYPDSQVLQIIHFSRITGKVKQSFLDKNNITEPMGEVDGPKGYKIRHIWVLANLKSGSGSGNAVGSDGSFTIRDLLPGTYDINFQVEDETGRTTEVIPVQTDLAMGENETKTLTLE